MKINWKVRFKNKIWLGSFLSLIVSFVYSMLGLFDIFPDVTRNNVIEIFESSPVCIYVCYRSRIEKSMFSVIIRASIRALL